uniref:non-specific serine/threonine protein kinase n=1 Tax=Gemmata sp. Wa1-1 TaxID=235140 RepID=Q5EUG6_9BACT|nr:GTP-binding protein [Gemmata sp. Wa1-1]
MRESLGPRMRFPTTVRSINVTLTNHQPLSQHRSAPRETNVAHDESYQAAERKIDAAHQFRATILDLNSHRLTTLPESLRKLNRLQRLYLGANDLTELPEWLGQFTGLRVLQLESNHLTRLPEWLGQLTQLQRLDLANNSLTELPEWLGQLTRLQRLDLANNSLTELPEWLGQLTQLQKLIIDNNLLNELPESLGRLTQLQTLRLNKNPLNPELMVAYAEGLTSVVRYMQAKAEKSIVLNEAKLILIGEGEVGKSCLLGALRGDPWEDGRPTTHGIEIKQVKVVDPDGSTEIILNGWDFGGQPVYRPTHQLFFSAPAVYLVVWKPREGPQAGAVKEWIKLVKHREPRAKILVVATHGGPKDRQPDIDRQEFWDLFGKRTVIDFFHIDSQPEDDKATGKRTGTCTGIKILKDAIARIATKLPEVGRTVPESWQRARVALKENGAPYLPLKDVLAICGKCRINETTAKLFVKLSHQLGHLIHYDHDPALRDIVVLKPDWLSTAISFVLDDKETRANSGLVTADRLAELWNDPARANEFRYESHCYPVFRRLMERYDISYRIAETGQHTESETSLIAQLVPDVRPEHKLARAWPATPFGGEAQQMQICRVVDTMNHSAPAEGLLYQLIVRLHKYSLGRADYAKSVHWQRGLVLEDTFGARALLEHVENDIRITVRSPYPERFLAALTYEVQWLVESFWKDLRCGVMVPCLNPLQRKPSCAGAFEVGKLIENKRRNRLEQPCPLCNEWQRIEELLHNSPAAQPDALKELLLTELVDLRADLKAIGDRIAAQHGVVIGRFDQADHNADARGKALVSKVEAAYADLIRTLLDEAKEGPRLFSFEPVEPDFFDRPKWVSEKFRFTLWCEHSRQPLPALNAKSGKKEDLKRGVYDVNIPRKWLKKAAPFLKVLGTTLSLVLPVAGAITKVALDEATYKGIEKQLDLGQKSLEFVLKGGEKLEPWLTKDDASKGIDQGDPVRADSSALRQLHVWLKEKDASFGGLVRVRNKRNEFLWVHEQFEGEY